MVCLLVCLFVCLSFDGAEPPYSRVGPIGRGGVGVLVGSFDSFGMFVSCLSAFVLSVCVCLFAYCFPVHPNPQQDLASFVCLFDCL